MARTDVSTAYALDTAGNRVLSADPRRAIEAAKGTALGTDDFITRWTYDALNQQLTETTPTTPGLTIAQRTQTSVYDELGNVRQATDFARQTSGTEFDRGGRTTHTFSPPATGTQWAIAETTYNPDGRVATSKDARQYADASLGYTEHAYDPLGRDVTITEATGSADESTTESAYDGLDRRIAYVVGGQASDYTFDLGGRVDRHRRRLRVHHRGLRLSR